MLKIDFQVHTHYSKCAISSPKEIIKAALQRNLDGIAITDHNTNKGYFNAKKTRSKLLIIPAIEVSSKDGHIIGLGITDIIPKKEPAEVTIQKIKDAGGIALIPHPFDYLRNCVGSKLNYLKPDVIEVYNANMITPFGNYFAKKFAEKNSLGTTAGSDAHSSLELGYAYTLVEDGSIDDILSYLIKQKAKTYGKLIPFHISFSRKIRAKIR
ncbi:MAG: PHP-associated domain-containing protein [Candidatus Odinarchaeia archaeon]